jgi:hypothetical protein
MKRNSPAPARQAADPPETPLAVPADAQAALAKVAAAQGDAEELMTQAAKARAVFDNMLYAAQLAHERAGIGRYVRPRYADEARRAAERLES